MAIRKTGWFIVAVVALVAGGASGYVITDTTGWICNTNTSQEASDCTSLDNSGKNAVSLWSDGAFPVTGKKYLLRANRLRAPLTTTAADGVWRFAGDALAIDSENDLALLGKSSMKYYFEDMRWHSGGIVAWSTAQVNVQGNITVDTGTASANAFKISGRRQTFNITARVTGAEGRARFDLKSENSGVPKAQGDTYGRTTVCFAGDATALYADFTLFTNTTLKAVGALPATITAKAGGEVTSAGAAVYNAATLNSGASLIVPGATTLSVGDLTLDAGSHLVWEMSEGHELGKLIVTGSISGIGATKLTLEMRNLTYSTNSVTQFDLLKLPLGSGYSLLNIELVGNTVSYAAVPPLYDVELVTEGDWMVYRVKVRPLVMHTRNDVSDYKQDDGVNYGTSFTNAASWSDHALPHANAVYRTPFSKNAAWYLRASEDPDCYPEFQGDALVLDYYGRLVLRSSLKVDHLTMLENSRIYMSDQCAVELSGHILIPEGATNVSVEAYSKKVQTISSDISGGGSAVFKVDGRTGSGTPCGTLQLTGDNSGFRGRILVTIATVAGKCPTLADGRHEILRIAAANNLGGALDAFTWNALALEQLSDLQITDDVTIEGASNRGVSISWDAAITVSDGKTFTVNTPVTYAGRLRKCGTGTLALGAKPRFIDGKEGTAPLAGTNVLDVTAGALMPLSAHSLEGVAVTFTNNTRWVVSAAQTGDFAQYGALCTNTVGGISTVATDGMIDVTVTDVVAAAKPQHEAALCTLPTHDSAEALRNKLRVAKPCPCVRLSTCVRDNADSSATVVVRADTTGMLLFVR